MAKVLLTHSYFLHFDRKQLRQRKPYPPLGTLYAAAQLRAHGFEVALFDPMFERSADAVTSALDSTRPDLLVIYDDGFNYLTKMCLTNMREAARRMATLAGSRGIPVAVCSSDSSDHPSLYLRAGASWVVRGEGEMTLLELAQALERGDETDQVAGLFLANGEGETTEPKATPPRPVLQDLDSLPLPAWDLVDPEPYRRAWSVHGRFSLNMATTRGCPYKCNWCAKPIYGNRYNSHSPERTAEELARLHRDFAPDHIWFCDDIFGLRRGWVEQYADELERRRLRIPFMIQSRADLLAKSSTVEALSRAGCETAWIGAESGSQKILDAMDKGITIEQIRSARENLRHHGIQSAFFLQFGYLGETEDDIRSTLKMLFELMPDDIGISVSYPLPGTPFYDKVASELEGKANWTDSDDLAMMFRSSHSPEFYRRLHRWVHRTYRREQQRLRMRGEGALADGTSRVGAAMAWLGYAAAAQVDGWRLRRTGWAG